jgi:hypothetical protein
LVELLIGLLLSTIVTGSMVLLMSNSLGTATRIIEMTQLTDELRNTVSLLTRDIRRANYNPYALYCYADPSCGTEVESPKFRFLNPIDLAGDGNCVIYFLERGNPDDQPRGAGGFRRMVPTINDSDTGSWIEVWTGLDASGIDCEAGSGEAGWEPITDPTFVDVTDFVIDTGGSLGQTMRREDGSVMLSTETCEVRVTVTGSLVKDRDRSTPPIVKSIQDVVRVRNDFLSDPKNPPDSLLCS